MSRRTNYEIMGVGRQAPAAEIKSQYRRLAKRYHPDLNPNNTLAAEQFQEVQAAYEVLRDPEKRRLYDAQLGDEPAFETAEYSHGQRWRSGPRAYRRYDGRSRQRPRTNWSVTKPTKPRTDYLHYTVEVSLRELFKGANRSLTVGRTFTCRCCRGKGKLEQDEKWRDCECCGGYGFVVQNQRTAVVLPPGLQPDMSIRLELFNHNQPEHPLLDAPITTNIAVTVQLRDSPPFEYHDNQLYTTTQVPAELLVTGGQWTIPAPEGGELTFKIPAGTVSGSTLKLRKRGLFNGSSLRRGNLLCTVTSN